MAKVQNFEELECWQATKDLTILIYKICENAEFRTEFTAKDQLKRASLSSMNNIAEGFGRFSNKEFIRFINIATASLDEVHSMILLYSELNFIKEDQKVESIRILKKAKYQSLGLVKYLNSQL